MTPPALRPARRGGALVVVLLALVGAAALVASTAALLRPDGRDANARWAAWRAHLAAAAAPHTLRADRPFPWADLGAGDSVSGPLDGETTLTLRRAALAAGWIAVDASAGTSAPGAPGDWVADTRTRWRRVPLLPPDAALLALDDVVLHADAHVDGGDTDADRWSWCAATRTVGSAMRMADPARLVVHPGARVDGQPAVGPPLGAAERDTLAGLDHRFAAAAIVRGTDGAASAAPRTAAGRCVLAADAWGDPSRPATQPRCAPAVPVVEWRPTGGAVAVVAPSRAQGTLVVHGDLVLQAPLQVAGLLVVHGALDARTAPLQSVGVVIARGAVHLGAGSRLQRGRCALLGAALGAAPPERADRAAWAP